MPRLQRPPAETLKSARKALFDSAANDARNHRNLDEMEKKTGLSRKTLWWNTAKTNSKNLRISGKVLETLAGPGFSDRTRELVAEYKALLQSGGIANAPPLAPETPTASAAASIPHNPRELTPEVSADIAGRPESWLAPSKN